MASTNGTASRASLSGISELARTKVDPKKPIGVTGVAIWGGYLQSNEKDPRLAGVEKYRTFSTILANVGIVAAGTRYFLGLVGKAEWRVVPADESKEATDIADFFEDQIHGMTTPWQRVVRRAAMHRFYGFSIQEWTAKKTDDGKIGLLDIEVRPQVTIQQWDPDQSGTLLGVVQWNPQGGAPIYLPRSKLWYTVDDVLHSSPEGLGLFRHLVSTATDLVRFEQLEGQGFNSDLRGVPVGRAPLSMLRNLVTAGTLTEAQATSLQQPILDFLRGHVKNESLSMMLDSETYKTTNESQSPSSVPLWSIDLIRGDPGSLAEIHTAITRKTEEIARILGVEHLLLGAEGKGSLALSQTKAQDMGLTVDGALAELIQSARADLVIPLMRLNGWDEDLAPTFEVESTNWRSPDEITAAIRDLATAGITLQRGDDAADEIYTMLGLTPPVEQDMAVNAMLPRLPGMPGIPGMPEDPNAPAQAPSADQAPTNSSAVPKKGAPKGAGQTPPDQMPVTNEQKATANAKKGAKGKGNP